MCNGCVHDSKNTWHCGGERVSACVYVSVGMTQKGQSTCQTLALANHSFNRPKRLLQRRNE